jgi:hypothetical protein
LRGEMQFCLSPDIVAALQGGEPHVKCADELGVLLRPWLGQAPIQGTRAGEQGSQE